MSESFWDPEAAMGTASHAPAMTQAANIAEPQSEPEAPAALAVSADDFAALEERIRRTVGLVKREREARAAAETHTAELDARIAQAEAQLQAKSFRVEQLQSELHALHTEREQLRQRVERLLKQLDALEL